MLENLITAALESRIIADAVVAGSITQSLTLWQLREHIPLAQAAEGKNIKHDVSIPISRIAEFLSVTNKLLQAQFPGCRMVSFGHLGDGNLHYNVSSPLHVADTDFIELQDEVNRVVHDSVVQFQGSISAEHGLGALKRDEICRYKSVIELDMMRAIKRALDPQNLMNPGKVV